MTSTHLGVDFTSAAHMFLTSSSWNHACMALFIINFVVVRFILAKQFLRICHKFSIGFRSGEFPDQSSTFIFLRKSLDQFRVIYRLRLDLEEERQKLSKMENSSVNHNHVNGPDIKVLEVQREANKQVSDYKFRLKKAEQEITTLQSNISRLESQVARYKTATENAEKVEDELKAEKRKTQRELREAQSRIEELETSNAHLQKRIDKLKSARTALIKS
ncbi:leucine-rich repeat flightless-interacting protein 2 [Trichonephila clavipes]|nr:leucine-rich repeat flightless-interacting protein 2 [Trichonephila clavipes]